MSEPSEPIVQTALLRLTAHSRRREDLDDLVARINGALHDVEMYDSYLYGLSVERVRRTRTPKEDER
jgi:hypothetical protein